MSARASLITEKQKIAIGICTYHRAAGLNALLAAVDRQRFTHLQDGQVVVMVIDNSENRSAGVISSAYASGGRFGSSYVSEPRKGLAFARNAAIAAARKAAATHLAFIDDDEVPHPLWLEALLRAMESTGTAAALGPVYPIFEVLPARWLPVQAYVTSRRPTGRFVDDGYTGNAILSMSAVEACGLSFDPRLNLSGGEDTYFFKKLIRQGNRIVWAEDAVVHEVVSRHRMSARWLWRRWYRTGALEAELGRHDPASLQGRLVNLARGLVRLAAGCARVIAGSVSGVLGRPAEFVSSFYTVCRGAGLVAKVFGRDYKEYSVPTYR